MICAKMAEPIDIPFAMETTKNHLLDGRPDLPMGVALVREITSVFFAIVPHTAEQHCKRSFIWDFLSDQRSNWHQDFLSC